MDSTEAPDKGNPVGNDCTTSLFEKEQKDNSPEFLRLKPHPAWIALNMRAKFLFKDLPVDGIRQTK